MLDHILAKCDDIYRIAREHQAEKVWVFGSCACKEETPESDVDLLVKFLPSASWREDDAMAAEIQTLFGRPVDVVRNTAVLNDPYFAAQVCPEAVRV